MTTVFFSIIVINDDYNIFQYFIFMLQIYILLGILNVIAISQFI